MKKYSLILASASPRRKELLAKIKDVQFCTVASNVDENVSQNLAPQQLVVHLASIKAKAVAKIYPQKIVLGADTIVVCDNKVLTKPQDAAHAKEMLRYLCGKTHSVLTGICLVSSKKQVSSCVETLVSFNNYNEQVVDNYIKINKCYDKAGGYGIQDAELAPLVKGVDGDIDNVIGLPVKALEDLLKENF